MVYSVVAHQNWKMGLCIFDDLCRCCCFGNLTCQITNIFRPSFLYFQIESIFICPISTWISGLFKSHCLYHIHIFHKFLKWWILDFELIPWFHESDYAFTLSPKSAKPCQTWSFGWRDLKVVWSRMVEIKLWRTSAVFAKISDVTE